MSVNVEEFVSYEGPDYPELINTKTRMANEPCGAPRYFGHCKAKEIKVHPSGHAWCAECGHKRIAPRW